jgi:hypothetical protein
MEACSIVRHGGSQMAVGLSALRADCALPREESWYSFLLEAIAKHALKQISDRSVHIVDNVEVSYQAIPGQEPVINMGFALVSCMEIFPAHSARSTGRYSTWMHTAWRYFRHILSGVPSDGHIGQNV